jgi:lysophospholipase L1-like esterase
VGRLGAAAAGIAMVMIVGGCGGGAATDQAAGPIATATAAVPVPAGTSGTVVQPALRAGAITIAAFGDSLTEGDCDDSGRGYPGRLLDLVNKVRPGSKLTNVGHSGWTSGDLADAAGDSSTGVARAIAAGPDVALVWIGSNDLWALYEYGPEPMTAQAEIEDLAAYEANLDTILGPLAGKGARIYLALLDDQSRRPTVAAPPNPAELAFPNTSRADLVRMSAHVTAFNEILTRKAAQYGATTVDFFHTTLFTTAATLCGDGNHPNESGYDAIAARWFAALAPALK